MRYTWICNWPEHVRAGHWLWTGANSNPNKKHIHHTIRVISQYGARYDYTRPYMRPTYPVVYDPSVKKTVPVLPIIYRMFQDLFKNRLDDDGRWIEQEDRPPLSLGYTVQHDRENCEIDLCVNPRHTRIRRSEIQYKNMLRKAGAKYEARMRGEIEPITAVIYNPEAEDVIGDLANQLMENNFTTYEEARKYYDQIVYSDSEIRLAFERLKSM